MSIRIRLRRDTAANWTSANPVLGLGEGGVETDTHKLKVGDGVTDWVGLAYYGGGGAVDSVAGLTGTISASALRGALYSGTQDDTTVARGDGNYANHVGDVWGVGGASDWGTLRITGTPFEPPAYGGVISLGIGSDQQATTAYDAANLILDVAQGASVSYIEGVYVNAYKIGTSGTASQYFGFFASGDHGAGGAFGFYSDIYSADGPNRYNFYAGGTAPSFFAGPISIGNPTNASANFLIQREISGASVGYGIRSLGAAQSDVTNSVIYFDALSSTQATAFNVSAVYCYQASQGTFGAGSTVTSQYGFAVAGTLVGATNNYGFWTNIPAGANRWNFYANGTAANFFGTTAFGVATIDASALVNFVSTSQGVLFPRMTTAQRNAITSPTPGLVIYNTDTGKLNLRGAAGWEQVTSA